ncbi:Ferric siderophore transport system, periplasmic binding protein TonB [Labilithrix luteola]|uniref:Ferric siderophore transport system, periplasmic binding protein TonB n=1 Tax=Labilithrix luteola TaxID=1391654 RepID=A0A0K1QDM3_9BACT|nr:hypothetical protein [Labilithrix luteola]AKV03818.1 Ferric siderophore transport system, periplasmic binding protein TonB [Labilithrix luteola]
MGALNGANAGGARSVVVQTRNDTDPFAGVLDLGSRMSVAVTIALAITLHAGVAGAAGAAMLLEDMFAWARMVRSAVSANLAQTYEIEIAKPEEPPPPPPPEPEPEPVKEQPQEAPPPPVAKQEKQEAPTPPPPPAAAEAAKVLTQEPAKDEPVDLTGNTFVTGSGSTYAGGTTQAGGTSKTAVYNAAAAATGVPGSTGTAPAPPRPSVDRSRGAGLLGSDRWDDCPFPGEADSEQIDQAYVIIQVKVKADGTAETVTIVQDPGHGFGREARKCAMRKRYNTALDVEGNAVGGMTKPFRIKFER